MYTIGILVICMLLVMAITTVTVPLVREYIASDATTLNEFITYLKGVLWRTWT